MVECSLDEVRQWKGEWNEARKYYDRAYDRMINSQPAQNNDLAYVLFRTGEILHVDGTYEEGHDYFMDEHWQCERKIIHLLRSRDHPHQIVN
ncbi:unnamed protein product [Rotaria socialis]|uniref:Uncharacterized protein n=1 Tax=Rotaria socialis TaxID=392032 RepID=A0A821DCD4_9BILA|nr:unnamed protein product [Rotaria socialis]CAF4619361.1 unnamed protein product [Rotaria socialis]